LKDSLTIILALSAHFDLELYQTDVKTTFLNDNLKEEIYMCQHKGFAIEGKVKLLCKLKQSIYGLKQTSRQWYLKFDEVASNYDFVECKMDKCVYVKQIGRTFVFLVLYVDDILLVSNEARFLQDTKNFLSKRFDMKDMGEATYVLGIIIDRDRSRGFLGMSQKAYIDKVLKR